MNNRIAELLEKHSDIINADDFNDQRCVGELVEYKKYRFTNLEFLANQIRIIEDILSNIETTERESLVFTSLAVSRLSEIRKTLVYELADLKDDDEI